MMRQIPSDPSSPSSFSPIFASHPNVSDDTDGTNDGNNNNPNDNPSDNPNGIYNGNDEKKKQHDRSEILTNDKMTVFEVKREETERNITHGLQFKHTSDDEGAIHKKHSSKDVNYQQQQQKQQQNHYDKRNIDHHHHHNHRYQSQKGGKKQSRYVTVIYLILLLVGTLLYQYSYEMMKISMSTLVLRRRITDGATILGVIMFVFGISQSLGSTFVEKLSKRIRASFIIASCLLTYGLMALLVVILEAVGVISGWYIFILLPVHVLLGFAYGMIAIARKLLPPLILYDASSLIALQRVNSVVHIFYKIAGTLGAFLCTVWISSVGPVYSMIHIIALFTLAAFAYLCILHPLLSLRAQKRKKKNNKKSHLRRVHRGFVSYFRSLWLGLKIVLLDRRYNWMMICFVIPQIIHRILDSMFFSLYSNQILKNAHFSGILSGASSLGEVIGGTFIFLLARRINNPLHIVRFSAVCLNLIWLFPLVPMFHPLGNAMAMIPVIVIISCTWAASDIALLTYLQSTVMEITEDGRQKPFASVFSVLTLTYMLATSFVQVIFGNVADLLKPYGLMITCGAISLASILVFFVAIFSKLEKSNAYEQMNDDTSPHRKYRRRYMTHDLLTSSDEDDQDHQNEKLPKEDIVEALIMEHAVEDMAPKSQYHYYSGSWSMEKQTNSLIEK